MSRLRPHVYLSYFCFLERGMVASQCARPGRFHLDLFSFCIILAGNDSLWFARYTPLLLFAAQCLLLLSRFFQCSLLAV